MLKMVSDRRRYLLDSDDEQTGRAFRRHEATGRPLGDDGFLARLLRPQKPGPKPKQKRS